MLQVSCLPGHTCWYPHGCENPCGRTAHLGGRYPSRQREKRGGCNLVIGDYLAGSRGQVGLYQRKRCRVGLAEGTACEKHRAIKGQAQETINNELWPECTMYMEEYLKNRPRMESGGIKSSGFRLNWVLLLSTWNVAQVNKKPNIYFIYLN